MERSKRIIIRMVILYSIKSSTARIYINIFFFQDKIKSISILRGKVKREKENIIPGLIWSDFLGNVDPSRELCPGPLQFLRRTFPVYPCRQGCFALDTALSGVALLGHRLVWFGWWQIQSHSWPPLGSRWCGSNSSYTITRYIYYSY